MNIMAIVPARMGSERMPRKNLCEIEPGLSLVQHAIDCARYAGIERVIVSSDEDIPFDGAEWFQRPADLCGPTADISQAVQHAHGLAEDIDVCRYDYVVTLQPAVVARSPLIVRRLLRYVTERGSGGGLTMAATHRWIWARDRNVGKNDWQGRSYPRSQDGGQRLVEINAVQIASRGVVTRGDRWGLPLDILELPPWCAALDIDTPEDLAMARDMWPWAKLRLETWSGPIHCINVATCA